MDDGLSPLRLGIRVCDRRTSFFWQTARQRAGRWNRNGDTLVHYLAITPTVAWAEWIRHQEIEDPADLEGVAAALWAVLIPAHSSDQDLQPVNLPMAVVLGTSPEAAETRLGLVDQLKQQGAQGLLAPTAALKRSDQALPCIRLRDDSSQVDALPISAQVIMLRCPADQLPGWCCVPDGRPGPELLPLVRREEILPS